MSTTKSTAALGASTGRRGSILASRPLMGWRTVDLLTIAFLGAALGIAFWGWGVFYNGPISLLQIGFAPAWGIFAGPWFIAGVVGGLVVRRPGAALLCVDRLRARIGDAIDATLGDTHSAHLLRALAFGDQHAMDEREWAVARATGIPHLIAISGLHIALFASFGIALVRLLWKLSPRLTLRWPAPLIEAVASLVFAVAYALIAGFGLPTRRALVMIAALLVANLARRARAPVHGLALDHARCA